MTPSVLNCPRCGAPLEGTGVAAVTCKFCGSNVTLVAPGRAGAGPPGASGAGQAGPAGASGAGQAGLAGAAGAGPAGAAGAGQAGLQGPAPAAMPSIFRARLRAASGLVGGALAGWVAVLAVYTFLRNGVPPAIPTGLLAGVVVVGAALSGRKPAAVLVGAWAGALLAAKPFLRPVVMKDGFVFGPSSETHFNYLVPGALLLATGALVAMSIRPPGAEPKAAAKAPSLARRALGAAVFGAGAVAAFASLRGETTHEVLTRYRPRFEAMQGALRAIGRGLPPPGSAATGPRPASLSPSPVYREDGSGNAAFFTPEGLEEAGAKASYDLMLSSDLSFALQWAGPNNPMSESSLYDRAGGFGDRLEAALACRYVVVYRPAGGDVEAFMFELPSQALVAAATAKRSADFTQSRQQLVAALAKSTGGTFLIR